MNQCGSPRTLATDDYSLGYAKRELTGLSHWHTMLFPKTNQSAVAFQWALRILQAASSLEAIGQHWLGLSAIHLGAAVPSMTPLMMRVSGDAVTFQSSTHPLRTEGGTAADLWVRLARPSQVRKARSSKMLIGLSRSNSYRRPWSFTKAGTDWLSESTCCRF